MQRITTTITIDADLHRRAVRMADRTGRTIGEVIEAAIRESLRGSPQRAVSPLPVFGRDGLMPGVDIADTAGLRQVMDEGAGVDRRR